MLDSMRFYFYNGYYSNYCIFEIEFNNNGAGIRTIETLFTLNILLKKFKYESKYI